MDRPIEKNNWSARRIGMVAMATVAVLGLAYFVIAGGSTSSRNLASDRITVAKVQQGAFQEYVPVNGTVQPNTTVFLDLEEGGIVERIYLESGKAVKKGDLLLSFSNTGAQKQNIETETRLLENLDRLRNSKLALTQSNLVLKEQLLDVTYKIADLERTYARYERLMKGDSSQLSREQFDATTAELRYLRDKRDLLNERIRREAEIEGQQNAQIERSIVRIDRNLELMARIIDSLDVRAPIDGYLSSLNAEVGQSFQRGQRIGQIDRLDTYKVQADVDQYYIAKVNVGRRGRYTFDGQTYELEVAKVYPEVKDNTFKADMSFVGTPPEGLRRGLVLRTDLSLSATQTAMMVEKGGFYAHTNGRWVYVVAPDGRSARRQDVVMGRQNPQYVEVLQGLKQGEAVITSSYDAFGDVDALKFDEALQF